MLNALVRRPLVSGENPPILVLLHGLGADEHDLIGLADELDPRLLVVSLRAPLEYGPRGYAWFEIAWDADGIRFHPEQVLASRDILIETLKLLPEALGSVSSRLFLGGFSQGAIMSLCVALAEPTLVAGVVSMSGRFMPEVLSDTSLPEVAGVPFLVQHGTEDEVLPVAGSAAIRDYLMKNGCAVTYHEYRMGHEISAKSIADVRRWLDERLRETP